MTKLEIGHEGTVKIDRTALHSSGLQRRVCEKNCAKELKVLRAPGRRSSVRRASILYCHSFLFIAASLSGAFFATAEDAPAPAQPAIEAVISVADQKLALLCNGEVFARYPVSTSRFGIGDNYGSYKTPLGRLRVCDKIGGNLTPGTVIRHREATREVLPANAPGRDPIVTRIIWLDGCESQNAHAHARGIYIHGTTEENYIGRPMSWGCIRMRSTDVIALYDQIPVGAAVTIVPERLPHYPKYDPRRDAAILAKKEKEQQAQQAQLLAQQQKATGAAATPPAIAAAEHPQPVKSGGRETLTIAATTPEPPAAKPAARLTAAPHGARDAVTTQELARNIPSSSRRADLINSMHSSILFTGVGDSGNSEIPRLGQQ
jgi:hypothetical protein